MPGRIDDRWLDTANAADLEALATALEQGRLVAPFTAIQIQQVGLKAEARGLLLGLAQLDEGVPPTGMAWMLRRLARERREADRRWAAVAQLVWSGPNEGHEPTRDTRLVLADIFARAERHVLIATYVIYDGRTIFESLARRMSERPDLAVDFYVNLHSKSGKDADEEDEVAAFVADFASTKWPSGVRLPNLYYDPETRKLGQKRVTLHAKVAVVDERWAFVTSANFTEAAQERNIEAGVLLDHPGLAGALVGRFRALREAGKMRRMQTGRTPLPGPVSE